MSQLPEFVTIPQQLINKKNLTGGELRVVAQVLAYSQQKGYCWAGQRRIAQRVGMSLYQVNRIISSLKKKGCLQILRRGKRLTNLSRPGPLVFHAFQWLRQVVKKGLSRASDLRWGKRLEEKDTITSKVKGLPAATPTPSQVDLWPTWLKDAAVRHGVM